MFKSIPFSSLVSWFRIYFNSTLLPDLIAVFTERREPVLFSIDIGNVKLMHERFPKHLSMGTGSIETEEEGKQKIPNKEVRKDWL